MQNSELRGQIRGLAGLYRPLTSGTFLPARRPPPVTEPALSLPTGHHFLRPYFGMSLATLFWASNAIAVKLALREVPELATVALRVTLAAATLAVLHALTGGHFHLRRSERGNFWRLSLSGVAASFFCYTLGLNYTSVSHAVFINSLVPMSVLLIARIQGLEKITPAKFAGLLLSLAGVLSLAFDKAQTQLGGTGPGWSGDLLVLGSVWCFAFFTVESKKLASAHPSLEFTTFAFLGAALWLSPLLAVESVRVSWKQITWLGWSSLLYSGMLGSAAAYLTYYYSLRLLPASRVAAFHYLQPALATALGVWIIHDNITARFGVGAALILAGLSLGQGRD